MKIGMCTSVANIGKAYEYGFDYIEPSVGSIAELSYSEFTAACKIVAASPIKAEAANCMLGAGMIIMGEKSNHSEIVKAMEHAYKRLSDIGIRIVVFGSGSARKIPENLPIVKARAQYLSLLDSLCLIAEKNKIIIVLEPLNKKETNFINSVSEGGSIVEEYGNNAFQLLADYYHMGQNGDTVADIIKFGKYIKHTHIANPITREVPAEGDGGRYEEFIIALKAVGYKGGISLEGHITDENLQAPRFVEYLKKLI